VMSNALVTFISLLFFLGLFYGPWQEICVDYARQFIFEKRDLLFNYAYEGRLEFQSNEYRSIRLALESDIRFAHEMTFPRLAYLVCYVLLFSRKALPQSNAFTVIGEISDPRLRDDLFSLFMGAQIAIMFSMISRSIVLIVMLLASIPLLMIFAVVYWLFSNLQIKTKRLITKLGDVIQSESESEDGMLCI
jgi:hypothetical protein